MCINFVPRLSSLLRSAIITTLSYVHICSCARQVIVVDRNFHDGDDGYLCLIINIISSSYHFYEAMQNVLLKHALSCKRTRVWTTKTTEYRRVWRQGISVLIVSSTLKHSVELSFSFALFVAWLFLCGCVQKSEGSEARSQKWNGLTMMSDLCTHFIPHKTFITRACVVKVWLYILCSSVLFCTDGVKCLKMNDIREYVINFSTRHFACTSLWNVCDA